MKKIFLSALLFVILIAINYENSDAEVGSCDNCTSVSWTQDKFVASYSCMTNCNMVIWYKWRVNTCVSPAAIEAQVQNILTPINGCADGCGTDALTNAMYYLMTTLANKVYKINDLKEGTVTPMIIGKTFSCYSSATITDNHPIDIAGLDTNLNNLDLNDNVFTTMNYSPISSTLATAASGTFSTISINEPSLINPLKFYSPCSSNCCSFQFVVQKVPPHGGGQILDVYLNQASSTYNSICQSGSSTFMATSYCKFKCNELGNFSQWPYYKRQIFEKDLFDNKSNIEESLVIPNPSDQSAIIQVKDMQSYENCKIIVINLNGEVLDEAKFNGKITLNTSTLASGTYYYYILSENKLISKGNLNVKR